jgi:[acyl-carrier-protein] S-malonyltransferase
LAAVLDDIVVKPMALPVITNVEATPNQDATRVRDLLVKQVSAPVRWEESVTTMSEMGVRQFVEIGPGKILSGLVKRIARDSRVENVENLASLRALQP